MKTNGAVSFSSRMVFLAAVLLCPPAAWSGPKITCDEPKYAFGTLFETNEVSHTFVLKNTGDAPLTIGKIQAPCGCTKESLEKRTVEAGDTCRLEIEADLKGRQGPQDITILVHSNDPDSPRYAVSMTGTIRRGVEVKPRDIHFRVIRGDPAYEYEIEVASGDGRPLRITALDTGTVAFAEIRMTELEPGARYRLKVSWRPAFLQQLGTNRGKLVIGTDRPKHPTVDVSLTLQVIDELAVVPSELEVRRLPTGGPDLSPRFLSVKSLRGHVIESLAVTCPLDSMKVETKARQPSEHVVRISEIPFRPALDGLCVQIRVRLADGTEKTLDVPIRVKQ